MGDRVFVGSNSTLVAPIQIEDGGFIGAGSTVTKAVPAETLAVARGKQRNIDGWVHPALRDRRTHGDGAEQHPADNEDAQGNEPQAGDG